MTNEELKKMSYYENGDEVVYGEFIYNHNYAKDHPYLPFFHVCHNEDIGALNIRTLECGNPDCKAKIPKKVETMVKMWKFRNKVK